MRSRFFIAASFLSAALFIASISFPARADVIYASGPAPNNYSVESLTINKGFAVSTNFVLGAASSITDVSVGIWIEDGFDPLTSLNWQITSSQFGGTVLGSGTATSFTSVAILPTPFPGFDISTETFSLPTSLFLAAGTYWLQLSGATEATGTPLILWDVANSNSGVTKQTLNGAFCTACAGNPPFGEPLNASMTFEILGTSGSIPSVPGPTVGAGIPGLIFAGGGLLAWFRRKKQGSQKLAA